MLHLTQVTTKQDKNLDENLKKISLGEYVGIIVIK